MKYLEKSGFILNPNTKVVNSISNAVERNHGHCPCHNKYSGTDKDLCPCSSYLEESNCCCGLYVRPSVVHYVLSHFTKNGDLLLDHHSFTNIPKDNLVIVINNTSRVSIKVLNRYLDKFDSLGYRTITYDIDSVSQVRNEIIKHFLKSNFTHMTMIDGDDRVSDDYHDVLQKFAPLVKEFGIFNGYWKNANNQSEQEILAVPDNLIKYGQHYTNWLYLYSRKFLETCRYPDIEGYEFPEDEYLFTKILDYAEKNGLTIPVIKYILYNYYEGNSKVAKMDTPLSRKLVEYVQDNRSLKYEVVNIHECINHC